MNRSICPHPPPPPPRSRTISCGDLVLSGQPRPSKRLTFCGSKVEYGICIKIEGQLTDDRGKVRESNEDIENTLKPFESAFKPEEMRCLALIAHNHMKPAMQAFVKQRQELLKKFHLTGTSTTMTMLKSVFGDDEDVVYGPSFMSGPLGGDAEVCALMCKEDMGCVLFFMDPLDPHPHQCDIDTVVRLANVHNVLMMTNPTSAYALCNILQQSLKEGKKDLIPSFFNTLESPGLNKYKEKQAKEVAILKSA